MSAWFWRSGIGFYQRFISPYKGYRCAHACYHGGPSCSHAIREILVEHGLIRGWPLVRQRFADCRHAYASMRLEREMALVGAGGAVLQSGGGQNDPDQDRDRRRRRRRKDAEEGASALCDCGGLSDACDLATAARGGARCCRACDGPGDCDLPCI